MRRRRMDILDPKTKFGPSSSTIPLNERHVEALMASIKDVGILQPIVVTRTPAGIYLVAGRHRLEAARRLKLKEIPAFIETENSPTIAAWREVAEIDENLVRQILSKAQKASHLKRRKAAYELLHPETKRGGKREGAGRSRKSGVKAKTKGGKSNRTECGLKAPRAPSFVADTARKTGLTERAVEQDVARAEALGDDVDKIVGTSLDSGPEMDALAKLPEGEREALIERAVAGESVSAVVRKPWLWGDTHVFAERLVAIDPIKAKSLASSIAHYLSKLPRAEAAE